jgi:RimJ/RimL family protein N-acetyltransferase
MEKPILLDIPYTFDSERLTIRGPLPGDGPRLREAVLESQEELKAWMPWAVNVLTEEEYEVLAREGQAKFLAREDLWMQLYLKGTDTLIGGSGLHRIDWAVPSVEIGYWVRTKYGRQGYITEAVAAITELAFRVLQAERVFIRMDSKNTRSAAVPQRLGFVYEGTLRHDARDHVTDELRDTMVFSKIRREFT